MDWLLWLRESTFGSLDTMLTMVLIIIPLMIGIEVIKYFQLIEKMAPMLEPAMRFLGLPKEAVLPLLAGLFLGILYGAGLIIQAAKEGILTRKHMTLIAVFLVVCHSLIEDHVLFTVVGANGLLLAVFRLLLAIIATWLVNKIIKDKSQPVSGEEAALGLKAVDTCNH